MQPGAASSAGGAGGAVSGTGGGAAVQSRWGRLLLLLLEGSLISTEISSAGTTQHTGRKLCCAVVLQRQNCSYSQAGLGKQE